MSTVAPPSDPEADPRVKAVFDDIRATRKTDFINEVKAVMAQPSALDPKVKEMIYAAVSVVNACDCCTHSHLAAARAKGMTGEEQADLFRIIALAAKTNALFNAIRPPVDPQFLAGA